VTTGEARRRPLAIFAAAILISGCRAPTNAPADGVPARVVSLAPPLTEALYALGVGDRLVARSDWCALPPEVAALPSVGSGLAPDLEAIVALRPDRVLIERSVGSVESDVARVAPVTALPWLTEADLIAGVTELGAMFDRPDAARDLVERLDAALVAEPPASGPRVLLALHPAGLDRGEVWFLKRDSLHGAALHAAGARNAVERDVANAPVLSVEELLAVDPDVVLIVAPFPVSDAHREALVAPWRALTPLRAARDGRIGVLGDPRLMTTGPSIVAFAPAVRAELARIDAPPAAH
jgi:ABC-type hemin transport system substrate-binding protein